MHPMSKKEKKPEDVTPEEQTEQAVPTEETEAEAPNPLLEELEALKKNLSDQEDKFLRLAAEYDNYRRRSQKEKESAWSDAKADTAAAFLPVYDNLERALKQETADEAYKKGVEMTMTQLKEVLAKLGIEEIPALGDHMIYPTLMAAAVGEHFGLTQTQIADGVLHFAPTKMRMNLLHRGDDITILNDTYNANPQSMRAAVEVLSSARGAYKVAVLGDMFELGPLAPALHAGVGDYLGKAGIDCLVAVGELARHIHDAAQAAGVPECYYCPTKAEARPVLDGVVRPHATILVKASRGMALEELVDYLLTITGEA